MGPLATLFSTIDSAKRKFSGLLDNPGGTFEQLMGQMQDYRRQDQQLGDQAYGDPRKGEPLIKDKEAFAQLGQRAFDNVMSFAPAGITVWHGSPHKFDKFDSSKIGTGEGAQAYGHGLYLAESPEVAKGYQQSLSGGGTKLTGASFSQDPELWAAGQLYSKIPEADVIDGLKVLGYKGDANALVKSASKRMGKELEAGSLYKVDLPDEHIAKMLDWDKPLSQQAPETIEALHKTGLVNFEKNLGPKASGEIGDLGWTKSIQSMSAEDFYRKLTEGAYTNEMFLQGQKKGAAQAVISDRLKSAGIPGIRYLDGSSRGVGQGTSNFVVFPGNEGLLTILERNGQPLR